MEIFLTIVLQFFLPVTSGGKIVDGKTISWLYYYKLKEIKLSDFLILSFSI